MDKNEVIKILLNEQTCVKTADTCDRDCAKCSLVMDSEKIIEAYNLAIKLLSEQRWIPCSERLPKLSEHKEGMVLVCYGNGSVRFNACWHGEWVQGNPLAWKPLPEPWKGEE